MKKQLDHILDARQKDIGEEVILQPLPHKDFRFANPFIVLHHLPERTIAPNSPAERIMPHPHRGFAPVTFMFQGEGYHKDSKGNAGVIKAGEVQWMFAGSGLLHSEGPSKKLLRDGGKYEFVQLWVNVPAANKWNDPYYQQVTANQMPDVLSADGVYLKLASGQYDHMEGPIKSFTPVTSIFGSIEANRSVDIVAEENNWTLLYILEGKVWVNDTAVHAHQLVIFGKAGTDIHIAVEENAKLLYLSAVPIDEPVAAKGNIVMNTQEEIEQAEQDYATGKFGTLTD